MSDDKVMGAVLVQAGECPLSWETANACFYCPFGNPTWCHYPKRHQDAGCQCRRYLVPVSKGDDDHGNKYSTHELL
jgi:hypothetical protein